MTTITQVRERSILFSGPMVRAILDGRKTQTRRVVKPQPIKQHHIAWLHLAQAKGRGDSGFHVLTNHGSTVDRIKCPYGAPGDRLWVRETWGYEVATHPDEKRVVYKADVDDYPDGWPHRRGPYSDFVVWRPSIHMPRWASRLSLEIVGKRVQPLHNISVPDCRAEGVESERVAHWWGKPTGVPGGMDAHVAAYRELWDQINGDGAWAANPWVWVIEFKTV